MSSITCEDLSPVDLMVSSYRRVMALAARRMLKHAHPLSLPPLFPLPLSPALVFSEPLPMSVYIHINAVGVNDFLQQGVYAHCLRGFRSGPLES